MLVVNRKNSKHSEIIDAESVEKGKKKKKTQRILM